MSALLDPNAIAKLKSLQLKTRTIVEGILSGLHRSPHHGSSIEFSEHKEYAPGDDLRRLDWRAYARFDKYYLKKFEDETNLRCYFLLDASGSMRYGSHGVTKFEYGQCLIAALTYLLLEQQDSPGIITFAGGLSRYLPPRSGGAHLAESLALLEDARAQGPTNIAGVLRRLVEMMHGRNVVFLVSDLLEEGEDALQLLKQIRSRKNDLVLFHLLDPAELEFPFDELTEFVGLEDEPPVLADPQGIRAEYLRVVRGFVERLRAESLTHGIEYHQVRTDTPYDELLIEFLRARMK